MVRIGFDLLSRRQEILGFEYSGMNHIFWFLDEHINGIEDLYLSERFNYFSILIDEPCINLYEMLN